MRPTSIAVLLVVALAAPLEAQTIFVAGDAPVGGDGSSWATAFRELDGALALADFEGGGEIWVAGGIYRPAVPTELGDARSASFAIPPGTTLLGGFAGTERRREQRVLGATPSILSGDLLGDDLPDWGARGDNAYHVLRASNINPQVAIDGFTVSAGNADGTGLHMGGGGLLFEGLYGGNPPAVGPRLSRLTFVDNMARQGGGAWVSSHVLFEACRFVGNRAVHIPGTGIGTGNGGAIADFNLQEATVLQSVLFSGNRATRGGALYGQHAAFLAVNSTFASNAADDLGGAVFREGTTGFLALTNCILVDNPDASGALDTDAIAYAGFPELLTVNSCLVENWSGSMPGSGSFDGAPGFLDALGPDGVPGSGDEDYRLQRSSPPIDAGSLEVVPPFIWPYFTVLPETDLRGFQRVLDGDRDGVALPDLGAYERGPRFKRRRL